MYRMKTIFGDQDAHCRLQALASLFSCSLKGEPERDGGLSQIQPPRFHLNCEPRQIESY
jgi:hypothetical protein